jgi:predicted dehydrogenase
MAQASKFRVGIVGCGGIAHHHLRGYRAAGADISVVFDTSSAASASFAATAETRAAKSIDEMLSADLNAVSICTPPGTHLACCEPFLRRGIPVLCEKPLEANAGAATRLAQIVEETGTPFMVGFCHRFHGPVIEVKTLLDRGALGRPLLLRNIFSGWVPLEGNHRINPQLSGGGVLADNGAHAIDLFRFLVGEPVSVTASTANLAQKATVEDFCCIQLLTDEPAAAGEILSSYSLRDGANLIEFAGSEGQAVISYGMKHLPECAFKPHGASDWIAIPHAQHPQRFIAEVAHFLECLRSQDRIHPQVTVEDGLRAAEIVNLAYNSANRGRASLVTR